MATSYSIPLGATGESVELRVSVWAGVRLFYRGERLKRKGPFKPIFEARTSDGQTHEIRMRGRLLDMLPRIFVDGTEVEYAPPLPVWMLLISGIALAQVIVSVAVIGGFVGAFPGLLAFYLGQGAMRRFDNQLVGALVALALAVAAWLIWAALVGLIILGAS